MPYGTLKVDNIVFTNGGVDQTITVSGIVASTSGNLTVTGTVSGNIIRGGTTVSGATVTGSVGQFGNLTAVSGTFTTISGGTYTLTSGVFASGTAANPSISFVGDVDTGIYSSAANTVAISTSGTGRLFVNSAGNVGVGTTSFDAGDILHVSSTGDVRLRVSTSSTSAGSNAAIRLDATTNGKYTIQTGADVSGGLRIFDNIASVERARIDDSGRLLVGTSSSSSNNRLIVQSNTDSSTGPGTLLIAKGDNAPASGSSLGLLRFGGSTHTHSAEIYAIRDGGTWTAGSSLPTAIVFSTTVDGASSPTEKMRIDSAGNVGVGTATPAGKCVVRVSDATGDETAWNSNYFLVSGGDGTASHALALSVNTSGNYSSISSLAAGLAWKSLKYKAIDHIFEGAASVERARIDSSGRLLVGTSSARTNFFNTVATTSVQVEGTTYQTASLGLVSTGSNSYDAGTIVLGKGRGGSIGSNTIVQSGDITGYISFQGNDGSEFVETAYIKSEVDGTPGANDMPGRLVFSTTADGASSPTARMTIKSDGTVGIGVDAPLGILHVAKTGGSTTPNLVIISGGIGDPSSVDPSIQFGASGAESIGTTKIMSTGSYNARALAFHTGTDAAGTERVRIDSSGNFGIGTSSPIQKLQVGGSAIIGRNTADASNTDALFLHSRGANSNNNLEVGLAAVYHGPQPSDSALTISPKFWNGSAYVLTERVRVTAAGEVGIGTTSPNQPLEVNGTIRGGSYQFSDSGTSVASYIGFSNSNGPTAEFWGSASANSGSLLIKTAGTERARIDSSGRLLVGTSSARSNFFNTSWTPRLQIEGTSDTTSAQALICNSSDIYSSSIQFAKSRGATIGSNTVVQANDYLGSIGFQGSDGTEFVSGASIEAFVDGTPGANDMPTRLIFATTADGASSPTERLRIQESGDLRIANATTFYPSVDNAISIGVNILRFSAVFAANGTIQTSDEREKTEVAEAILGSDFVKSLRPVSYKWIEGGKRDTGERDESNNYIYESVPGQRTHWGFIAQEVKEAVDAAGVDFGGWVLTDKDDPGSQQALRYDQFIAPLTKALQEALAKIETLEAKVAALEAQ